MHILVSIPEYQTAAAISDRLDLPIELVKYALTQLEFMGLVERNENRWRVGKRDIHLPENSVMNELNHTHWRLRALADVQKRSKDSVHYTSIFAVSRADALRIREMVMELVMKSRQVVLPSPEEELFCMTCDFFE